MMKSTYGTGCFALMNIGAESKLSQHKLLTSIGYVVNGERAYVLEGSTQAGSPTATLTAPSDYTD